MIAAPGVFLLALATAVPSTANIPMPARQWVAARAEAPSFEQISRLAVEAWNDTRDDEAIRLFKHGLKLKPDWDEGLWYLGTIFYEKEQFREARELLRHYLAQNPNHGPGWALLGLSDYKLREYGRALEHLQRSVALGLEGRKELASPVFYYEALLFTRYGQFQESSELLYRIRGDAGARLQTSLEVPAGLNVLGYQLLPEEVPPERLDLAQRAGAAIFARFDQRREDAKAILSKLVVDYPNEKGPHFQYGVILLEEHSPTGVEEMHKVLAMSPSNTEARLRLAEYYLAQSQPAKARQYAEEALKLEPSSLSGHMLKGEILSASSDFPGAIAELEQAKRLAPRDSRVLWALLRAYNTAGRRDDAARVKAEIEKLGSKAEAAR